MGLTVSDIQNKQATCIILTERVTNITKPKDLMIPSTHWQIVKNPLHGMKKTLVYKVVALNLLPLSYSFLSCIVPSHRSLTLTEHWTFSGIANWISSYSISSGCDSGDNYCVL